MNVIIYLYVVLNIYGLVILCYVKGFFCFFFEFWGRDMVVELFVWERVRVLLKVVVEWESGFF